MNAFVALGVDVAVTELDVRLDLPANATTETQQVADYYSTVAACANVEACVGITVWDFDGKCCVLLWFSRDTVHEHCWVWDLSSVYVF